ncbi:hypothetical protein [Roseofilum casamattae]|uniref:Uncharacterized protein n=1 Tax=Roseofilum casamattae BLCC-M143 TaxID=3022442 RepID=A0ABT7C352_9CYAN|nr:hypothetical protein [Roseofilum casamattae]MDJ1185482.1 hypothetical protein [Roseofilum casamattae BLCC-M143]
MFQHHTLPPSFNMAELVFEVCHTGKLTQANRKQLRSILLQPSISEEEHSAIDRLLYAIRRGWLKIAR